jgi:CRISPR/Cas system CSM-associated protein Csm2 small subunit
VANNPSALLRKWGEALAAKLLTMQLLISKEYKINIDTFEKETIYYVMADNICKFSTPDEDKAKKFYEAFKLMVESGPVEEIILSFNIPNHENTNR